MVTKKKKARKVSRRDVAKLEFVIGPDGLIQVHTVKAKDERLNVFAAHVNGALFDKAVKEGHVPVRIGGRLILATPANLTKEETGVG